MIRSVPTGIIHFDLVGLEARFEEEKEKISDLPFSQSSKETVAEIKSMTTVCIPFFFPNLRSLMKQKFGNV